MISVIVPVYNVEKYLRDCLDSIIAQTYEDKEVLLIDDGSMDSSGLICDEYVEKYPYIRVIHQENKGSSAARNNGIENAKGEWIIFLDSDDVWADKNCLTKLHDYATSLNLDVVRFEYQAVNEKLEIIEQKKFDKSFIEGRVINNFDLIKYGIDGEWFTVLFLIKRYAIGNVRFNEKKVFQEDVEFYSRIFANKRLRCGYLYEIMYFYRKISTSVSSLCRVDKLNDSFNLCELLYSLSAKILDKDLKNLYIYYSIMMYYWTLRTLAAKPYYKQRESIIKELNLIALHKRVVERINDLVERKYLIFIKPNPRIGVKLLHFKDELRALLS